MAERRIRFIGNPKEQPAPAFMEAATCLGFDVETGRQRDKGAHAPFTVEARDPGQWKLRKGSTPVDQAVRMDNCASLIEALLVREIRGR